jgi:hypothetical protein
MKIYFNFSSSTLKTLCKPILLLFLYPLFVYSAEEFHFYDDFESATLGCSPPNSDDGAIAGARGWFTAPGTTVHNQHFNNNRKEKIFNFSEACNLLPKYSYNKKDILSYLLTNDDDTYYLYGSILYSHGYEKLLRAAFGITFEYHLFNSDKLYYPYLNFYLEPLSISSFLSKDLFLDYGITWIPLVRSLPWICYNAFYGLYEEPIGWGKKFTFYFTYTLVSLPAIVGNFSIDLGYNFLKIKGGWNSDVFIWKKRLLLWQPFVSLSTNILDKYFKKKFIIEFGMSNKYFVTSLSNHTFSNLNYFIKFYFLTQ